ncbi:MAG: pyridoxamine 5'-phosphate oxidase family protein [Candidatus Heimdallarchaeota archaeon]|nr:pyridoxamine 5'-phosphate oxidase family protein [Candidatus Heimdallarchaeota archaeon]MCG3256799.1 pyridoxamine 5'-phosphate oxidase family protein [Candidatus Heimdallarchaeota archaeon]MCK4611862.1 pyridoxamine 5'-phosphate oxidase family protein [Candidatus Heimdallarchaeota archaeon]
MSYKAPPPMNKEEIYEFLKEMKVARLCTLNKDSTIHSVPVWYILEDENVVIFAPEKSQKTRNIKRNNKVTVLIDNQETSTKGVIIYGEAEGGYEGSDEDALTLFRRYMEEEKTHQYLEGAKSLAKWLKFIIKPTKFASFNYLKDVEYREAMGFDEH